MEQNKNDEIDLIYVFSRFKKALKTWIKLLFKAIDFIIKKWIIIIILIFVGVALGFLTQKNYKPSQKATALIRVNFNTVDYVYSEIDIINEKVKEQDSVFFSNMGLKGDSLEIEEIEISPIINLNDILEKYELNDRKLEGLLRNLEFEDDNVKIHETFNSDYKYHKLEFTFSEFANDQTLKKTISYINSNEILEELKNEIVKDVKDQIAKNIKSIEQIDHVIDTYQTNESMLSPSDQIFVVDKNFSIHILFDRKIELQKLNEDFNKFLVYAKDIVVVVNKPNIIEVDEGVSGNKIIYYPILFIFIFLLLSFVRYTYFYLREFANTESTD